MANFCGGIKLNDKTLKLIDGVICDIGATAVDKSKAVSTCGQLWDGDLFAVTTVNGSKVITLHNSEAEDIGKAVLVRGNCGVGLDARFFRMEKNTVLLKNGFILMINTTPSDATIKVTDAEGLQIQPVTGSTRLFLLEDLGDNYTVEVSKDGYTAQTQTIKNTKDQTINVMLVAAG